MHAAYSIPISSARGTGPDAILAVVMAAVPADDLALVVESKLDYLLITVATAEQFDSAALAEELSTLVQDVVVHRVDFSVPA